MSRSRLVRAGILASGAVWLLSTHVFVTIDLARSKLVTSPLGAIDGRVRVITNDTQDLERLGPPFALIARVRSESEGPSVVDVDVDGHAVCERRVPSHASRRIDCVVTAWNPETRGVAGGARTAHAVTIASSSAAWTLEYLELATHYGNTSGANYLVILPAIAHRDVRPGVVWIVFTSLAVFLALVSKPPRWLPRWVEIVARFVAGIAVAWLVAVQCSNWVSEYRVVLSLGTFVRGIALALGARTWFAIRWLVAANGSTPSGRIAASRLTTFVRAGLVAVAVLAVYDSVARARLRDSYSQNYSGFLLISEATFDRNPLFRSRPDIRNSLVLSRVGGYDGEFMYFAAFDPFLRAFRHDPIEYRQVMDGAPYRFGRIGYSWLTWIFSTGRWERYPATMIWLILCALALASFVLAMMAQEHGLSPALGGAVVAIAGFWPSLQSGLPEPIAAATLLAGLYSLSRDRPWLAGTLFALSLLVRETGLVIVGCALVAALLAGRRREAASVALLAGGALVTWRLYVALSLLPHWGLLESLSSFPSNFGPPFAGIRDLWQAIARGQYYPTAVELSRAGITYSILLLGAFLLAIGLAATVPSATTVAALVYAIAAISLNFQVVWLHVGNAQRVTYELFLLLAVCCVTIRTYSRPLQRGLIAFWSCAVAYVFFFTFDASYIRRALGMPF